MRNWDHQEEEKADLIRFQSYADLGQFEPLQNWFHRTRPWEVSLTFGLVMIQLTADKFKGVDWWDTWVTAWVMVHRKEPIHILASGFVSSTVLDAAKELVAYDEHIRQRDLFRSKSKRPRWHILGKL